MLSTWTTGLDRTALSSPVEITATVAGRGDGSSNGVLAFDPPQHNQRPALTLANGQIYIMFASHADTDPYHGWVMTYSASTLAQTGVWCTSPDGGEGGIWQAGHGVTIDASGNAYLITGNGSSDVQFGGTGYGEAFVRLGTPANGALPVLDWFMPSNYNDLNVFDADLGSSGLLSLPGTSLMVGGGKQGILYVVDTSGKITPNMGHLNPGGDQIVQEFQAIFGAGSSHIHGAPIYYNSPATGPTVYVWGENDFLRAYKFNAVSGLFNTTAIRTSTMTAPVTNAYGAMPGGFLSLSANGSSPGTGIIWATTPYNANANGATVDGIFHAFDAATLKELWNDKQNAVRDDIGHFAKFAAPTVADGKVFVPTFGRAGSPDGSGALLIYGLFPTPPGFTEKTVVSGLNAPTAMAFLPDNRMLIAEKAGHLRLFKNGAMYPFDFLTLRVDTASERGLLGVAVDPDFTTNGYIYLYYTPSSDNPKNRVSRFTAYRDQVVPGSELILVDNIPSDGGNHNAGCVRIGPDKKLYISTGDGGTTPANSQNLNTLAGKILRINTDGTIPTDNPFYNQPKKMGQIYCYGLRNPFRFSFRPTNGAMFIADVGQDTWEEINVGMPGANYGWNVHEGPASATGFADPVFAYNHDGVSSSITGGAFSSSSNYPMTYRGSYFFGDYARNVIRRAVFDPSNGLQQVFDFTAADSPVDFAEGNDGNLYYVSIGSGTVRRFNYVGANYDQNHDGKPDLLFQRASNGQALTYLMNGTAPASYPTLWPGGGGWKIVGTPDLNQNGTPDILWQRPDGALLYWIMSGTTMQSSGTLWRGGNSDWHVIGTADFNRDTYPDIIWQNSSTGEVQVWLMNGTTVTARTTIYRGTPDWKLVGTTDFNRDGYPDLLWQNSVTGSALYWLMNGLTTLSTGALWNGGTAWQLRGAVDFNRDGSPDLIWENPSAKATVYWLMQGVTQIGTVALPSGNGLKLIGVADFNLDGSADPIWQNLNTGAVSYSFLYGVFTTSDTIWAGGVPDWKLIAPSFSDH